MLNKEQVINNFPCPTFRTYQKEVLTEIVEAVNSDYKCFLLDCPTGFGKSPLNIALGRTFNNAFYITPQNPLIDQLRKDQFCGPYLTEIKGKSNYECIKDNRLRCDTCLKKISKKENVECDETTECPYQLQKQKAFKSQILLTNFAYFHLVSSNPKFLNRELMIIDEAHNISEDIVKGMSIIISPHTIPLNVFEAHQQQLDAIKEKDDFQEYPELNSTLQDLALTCNNKKEENESLISDLHQETISDNKNSDKIRNLSKENHQLEEFSTKIENYLKNTNEEHVFKVDKVGYWAKTFTRITLQPIYAKPFMAKKLWNKSDYFVLSSATLMDINLYLQETGLDQKFEPDEIKHISVPSTFPIENRPIINASVGKLTYTNREYIIPLAIKRVEEILDIEKGNVAIHCHSYDNSDVLYYKINPKYRERLIRHDKNDRQEQLETWKNNRNKVFLSINFEEGQDWVGDVCTAQILFKVPYLNLADKRVRIRVNGRHENSWFNNETLKKVIQSYGRAVRSENDKANFYVIDESFFYLLSKSESIPDFFANATVKNWLEWKQTKTLENEKTDFNSTTTKELICGFCQHFKNTCSHKSIFTPVLPNKFVGNVLSVGYNSVLALNCQNFNGEKT